MNIYSLLNYGGKQKMPYQDRTGPFGRGQLTGRGLGPCGFRKGFRQPINLSKEEEKKILEAELKEIELEKKEIEKKLKEVK